MRVERDSDVHKVNNLNFFSYDTKLLSINEKKAGVCTIYYIEICH